MQNAVLCSIWAKCCRLLSIRKLALCTLCLCCLSLLYLALKFNGSIFTNIPPLEIYFLRDRIADDVTLATHLSTDRLDVLPEILRRWSGPVAASIYVRDFAADNAQIAKFQERYSTLLGDRFTFCIYASSQRNISYPVNIMRNRALTLVDTELVLLLDVDFLPDTDMYHSLRRQARRLLSQRDMVYVLPAFEPVPAVSSRFKEYPRSYEELLQAVADGTVQPSLADHIRQQPAHLTGVNYQRWYEAEEMYEATYNMVFEPYLLMPINRIPPFSEAFLYYGDDKVQHCVHLRCRGFRFMVLPKHFVVHVAHTSSTWAGDERTDALPFVEKAFSDFLHSLRVQGCVYPV